jgi:hypothetical protein
MSKYNRVSLHIIALFVVAMAYSFIPDASRELFGDTYCSGAITDPVTHELTECMYGSHGYNGANAPVYHLCRRKCNQRIEGDKIINTTPSIYDHEKHNSKGAQLFKALMKEFEGYEVFTKQKSNDNGN